MRVLAFILAFSGFVAATEKPWTLPKAEADQWAGRIQKLLPSGWSVSIRGNDLVVQREKPVRFARIPINAPAAPLPEQPPAALREGTY